jgi:lysozyme family protein
MVQTSYDTGLKAVLKHEGGYVNHPRDPGGATNKGITYRTYNSWRKSQGKPKKNVKSITNAEVAKIYKEQYWDAVKGDKLPAGLDYCIFDYAVNSGPGRAAKELQRIVGVAADGSIGNDTLGAVSEFYDQEKLIEMVCDKRLAFLKRLKHWKTFKNGWTKRVKGVRILSLQLAKKSTRTAPKPFPEEEFVAKPEAARAMPSDIAITKTPEAVGGGMAAVGTLGSIASEAADKLSMFSDYSWVLQTLFVVLLVAGIGFTAYASLKRIREVEH